jgi:hypothetical protein
MPLCEGRKASVVIVNPSEAMCIVAGYQVDLMAFYDQSSRLS